VPKPRKVEYSPTALFDLEDIADYIARDNPVAPEQWVDKLIAAAEKVASHPRSGRAVPETDDPKIREVIVGDYRLVNRVEEKRLLVLTVIEGHRRLRGLPEEVDPLRYEVVRESWKVRRTRWCSAGMLVTVRAA
jgi:addiction module RelE/StbE family toxin